MRLITHNILREHIGPFVFSLSTIIFVFLLNVVFRDLGRLIGKGLPFHIILEFFFLNMAWIAALAIPMAVLVSTLMAFGRMSQDNEITALKSSGVNLYRIIRPVFLFSIVLALGMERFNNIVLPEFNHRYKQLYADISKKRPTATIEPNVFFDELDNFALLVRKIKEDSLEGIHINDTRDPQFSRTIIAKHGVLKFIEHENRMILDLIDGEFHEVEIADLEKYSRNLFERQVISVPMENMTLERTQDQRRGDREKSADTLWKDVHQYEKSRIKQEKRILDRIELEWRKVFPDGIWADSLKEGQSLTLNRRRELRESRGTTQSIKRFVEMESKNMLRYEERINAAMIEIHKKYSIPVACMVFVLIGAPLGILARRGGLATGAGLSLVFFLIYWAFLIGGEQLGDRGLVGPAIAMWAPNIIVGGFGLYLVFHTVQEMTMIQYDVWIEKMKQFFRKSG